MAILKYVLGNMRRSRSYAIAICILVFLTGLILSVTISTMSYSTKAYDKEYTRIKGPDLLYLISGNKYSDDLGLWFKQRDEVESVRLRHCYYSNGGILQKDNKTIKSNISYHILPYDPGDKMRLIDAVHPPTTYPSKGEIYLPYIYEEFLNISVGDKVDYVFDSHRMSFKVAGFVEEMITGGEMDGENFIYISPFDIDQLIKMNVDQNVQLRVRLKSADEAACYDISKAFMKVYGTDIVYVKMKPSVMNNIFMLPSIAMAVMFAFAFLLCAITITIMRYAILATIEKDFTDIGIIKALGFTPVMVQVSITVQYALLALLSGTASVIAGIFATPFMGQFVLKTSGLLYEGSLTFAQGFLILIALVAMISLFSFLTARHSKKISPVRAIANGAAPVYFTSRLNVRLTQLKWLPLNFAMTLKQVLTKSKRYLLLIGISAILAYALAFSFSLVDTFQSEKALGMMGAEFSDIEVITDTRAEADLVVSQIKQDYDVEYVSFRSWKQLDVDGDRVAFDIRDDFYASGTIHPLKGHFPKHDNEVAITSLLASRFHKTVGNYLSIKDENGADHEFIITGIFQTIQEGGLEGYIHSSGLKLLYPEFEQNSFYMRLKNIDNIDAVISQMKAKYTGYREIENQKKMREDMLGMMKMVFVSISGLFFVLSLIIISVITLLMIKITVYGEMKELGIYKAVGFSSARLRWQLAQRFAMVTAFGGAFGVLIESLFGSILFSIVMKSAGISSYYINFNILYILLPIVIISALAMIASFLSSGNTKRVSVYGLISE